VKGNEREIELAVGGTSLLFCGSNPNAREGTKNMTSQLRTEIRAVQSAHVFTPGTPRRIRKAYALAASQLVRARAQLFGPQAHRRDEFAMTSAAIVNNRK